MALGWLWWRAWFPFGAVVAASVCVAGVALGEIDLRFAWQAWHLCRWAGSGDALGSRLAPWLSRPFAWQAWQAWRLVTSTFVLRGRSGTYVIGLALVTRLVPAWRRGRRGRLRGRRGTWRHPSSFCVAGVALGDIDLRFAWQAWYLVRSTFVLRVRRGAYGTGLALVTPLVPVWRRGRRLCLHGRRGT